MQFLSLMVKGVLIGAGAVLPGISSGVICVVTGIYEKILDAILGFFHNIFQNIKFLFPLCLGSLVGIFLFSNFIRYCFYTIPCQTKSLFIGLLLGSLVSLIKINFNKTNHANQKYFSNYISLIVCFLIGLLFIILKNQFYISNELTYSEISSSFLMLSGFIMSIGIVVPRSK